MHVIYGHCSFEQQKLKVKTRLQRNGLMSKGFLREEILRDGDQEA